MKRPFIAVSLSGVVVDKFHFTNAHEQGMKEIAKKSGMKNVLDEMNSTDYFKHIEKAVAKMYPKLNPEERVIKRRGIYLTRVLKSIEKNPEYDEEAIDYLKSLKNKYDIVLVTTIAKMACGQILGIIGLGDFFSYVFTSEVNQKDDKKAVIEKMVSEIGEPVALLSYSKRDEKFCKKKKIKYSRSLDELKKTLKS